MEATSLKIVPLEDRFRVKSRKRCHSTSVSSQSYISNIDQFMMGHEFLKKMEEVSIHGLPIDKLPTFIYQCDELQVLDLKNNRINHVKKDLFFKAGLEILDLSSNRIKGSFNDGLITDGPNRRSRIEKTASSLCGHNIEFSSYSNIREISFTENDLTDINLNLKVFKYLERLDAASNDNLKIFNLTNIRTDEKVHIDLCGCSIVEVSPNMLFLSSTSSIDLRGNPLRIYGKGEKLGFVELKRVQESRAGSSHSLFPEVLIDKEIGNSSNTCRFIWNFDSFKGLILNDLAWTPRFKRFNFSRFKTLWEECCREYLGSDYSESKSYLNSIEYFKDLFGNTFDEDSKWSSFMHKQYKMAVKNFMIDILQKLDSDKNISTEEKACYIRKIIDALQRSQSEQILYFYLLTQMLQKDSNRLYEMDNLILDSLEILKDFVLTMLINASGGETTDFISRVKIAFNDIIEGQKSQMSMPQCYQNMIFTSIEDLHELFVGKFTVEYFSEVLYNVVVNLFGVNVLNLRADKIPCVYQGASIGGQEVPDSIKHEVIAKILEKLNLILPNQ